MVKLGMVDPIALLTLDHWLVSLAGLFSPQKRIREVKHGIDKSKYRCCTVLLGVLCSLSDACQSAAQTSRGRCVPRGEDFVLMMR